MEVYVRRGIIEQNKNMQKQTHKSVFLDEHTTRFVHPLLLSYTGV